MTISGSVLDTVNTALIFPFQKTGFHDERTTPEMLENATILESIGTRGLFVLQILASLLALPLILIIGTLAGLVRACAGQGSKGFKEMSNALSAHVLVGLPVSIHGIFASLKSTHEYYQTQMERAEEHSYTLIPQNPPA